MSASQDRPRAALPPLNQGHEQNRPPTYAAEKAPDEQRIVALLAEESQVPVADVARLYANEHAKLAAGAQITKFLHIFATRNVREILRKRRVERLAMPVVGRKLLAAQGPLMPLMPLGPFGPTGVFRPLGMVGPLGSHGAHSPHSPHGSHGSPGPSGSGWAATSKVAELPPPP